MSLDKDTVTRIAHLARIKVPAERLETLSVELSGIIDWVEQLGEVDTDGVAPLSSIVGTTLPRREDAVTDGGRRDDVLANAPAAAQGFYVVPKVLE